MDYEKKYKQSLALMGDCIPDEDGYVHVRPQDIFPELCESEDEKIRKALIEYFNEQCDMSDWNGVYGYQVVAWLEKQATPQMVEDAFLKGCNDTKKCLLKRQGEQKPTDEDMIEALRTEYEKGRADAFSEIGEKFDDCRRRNDVLGFLEFLRLQED